MTNNSENSRPDGFSFIEFLMILSAAIILLTSVDSWLSDYKVRSKVSEALAIAETATREIVMTCSETHLTRLTNAIIPHDFPESPFVEFIDISGSCHAPMITLATRNTGLNLDPVLVLEGTVNGGVVSWECRSNWLEVDTPERCQVE